jgi:hypothetical protein
MASTHLERGRRCNRADPDSRCRRSASDYRDGPRTSSRAHLGPCRPCRDPVGLALEPTADGRRPPGLDRWEGCGVRLDSYLVATFVYYRSADKKLGLLQREGGDPVEVLALTGSKTPKHGECERSRVQETAALAVQHHTEGLVVVYSHQRTRIDGLVAAVAAHFATQPFLTAAELKRLVEPLEESDPDYVRLIRLGIGVHHANVPRRVRSAVEVAARKNLLRCVICSPTLLEGVDFPTKTVIAAYPPQTDRGKPEIGKLRNLAGRAGRGGRFSSATLIVMSEDDTQATKWLRAFSAELPVTHSALSDALQAMFNWGQDVLSGQEPSDDKRLAVVDATILAAIAEGAISRPMSAFALFLGGGQVGQCSALSSGA